MNTRSSCGITVGETGFDHAVRNFFILTQDFAVDMVHAKWEWREYAT